MAVLGGLEHNKDPRKLLRFSTAMTKIAMRQENSITYSNESGFFLRKVFEGAVTDTDYSANTVKQIYSVSGSSGFFFGAISPNQSTHAGYVTWTIVVDGVSYSIQQGNHTKPESDCRFILGDMWKETDFNGTSSGADNYTWDTNRGSININGGSNSQLQKMRFPFNTSNDSNSTVFFSTSFTISCTPTGAQTGTYSRRSGALVRLID